MILLLIVVYICWHYSLWISQLSCKSTTRPMGQISTTSVENYADMQEESFMNPFTLLKIVPCHFAIRPLHQKFWYCFMFYSFQTYIATCHHWTRRQNGDYSFCRYHEFSCWGTCSIVVVNMGARYMSAMLSLVICSFLFSMVLLLMSVVRASIFSAWPFLTIVTIVHCFKQNVPGMHSLFHCIYAGT